MELTTVVIAALFCSLGSAYPISADTLNCRSGPGTDHAVVKSYTKGQEISITCQTEGTSVQGHTIWNKTPDGCYVSDYYVKTGSSGYVAAKCDAGNSGNENNNDKGDDKGNDKGGDTGGRACGPPASNKATVDLIAEFEGFEPKVCKYSLFRSY
jgi:lysozyme